MFDELVLATRNPDKAKELVALLVDVGLRIRTLAEFPAAPVIEEDGATCEANAVKKATTIARVTGRLTVADDTGLLVDALDGRPGVHAARFAGPGATYEENCRRLLREMVGVPRERRSARFVTVAALADPQGRVEVVKGVLEGWIAEAPAGRMGFGYDPVFVVPELGKTLAQLTLEEKNRISHRAKAFGQLKVILTRLAGADPSDSRGIGPTALIGERVQDSDTRM
jgi:XTP/dITP diphosphohydrolase